MTQFYDEMIQNALGMYISRYLTDLPLYLSFDPEDQLASAYVPTTEYKFISVAHVDPNGFYAGFHLPCWDSALALARAAAWLDKKLKNPGIPPLVRPGYIDDAGCTIIEMKRHLQRAGIQDFPVYEFCAEDDNFELVNGTKRKDGLAIVFIPRNLAVTPPMPDHHWTFGYVDHTETVPFYQRKQSPALVYSKFPVEVDNRYTDYAVFWRAQVAPENHLEYCRLETAGYACDCHWDIVCEHEVEFLSTRPTTMRITLDGDRHVIGTRHGIITCCVDSKYSLHRKAPSGIVLTTPSGHTLEAGQMHPSFTIEIRDRIPSLKKLRSDTKYMRMSEPVLMAIYPYMVSVKEFLDDQEELLRWDLSRYFTTSFRQAIATIDVNMGNAGIGWGNFQAIERNVVTDLFGDMPEMAWAEDRDLNLKFPRKEELLNRLVLRKNITDVELYDTLRRMCNEERWNVMMNQDEIEIWINRVIKDKGKAAILPLVPSLAGNHCWSCGKLRKTHWHMCKECKRQAKEHRPAPLILFDAMVTSVGFRPLWSELFTLPKTTLKEDVIVTFGRSKKVLYNGADINQSLSVDELITHFWKHVGDCSVRGYLRGPMFLGMVPKCFPKGSGTACLAFLVRLGVTRLHQAQMWYYDRCFEWLVENKRLAQIQPESWEQFISHFSGDKKLKNELARQEELDGWLPIQQEEALNVKMSGFVKGEKSYNFKYDPYPILMDKKEEKPRFICSPKAVILAKIGKYTHAQTKWLAKMFSKEEHLFYAGCATPSDLNYWLNMTISECPDPYTLVDDITAMDSNHSKVSFAWHKRIRAVQFPYIPDWVSAAYDGEEKLKIKVGDYELSVNDVNASGVSDTSYKNSMLCLPVRLLALTHGLFDITRRNDQEVISLMNIVERNIWMSVSGDDGIVRMPAIIHGKSIAKFNLNRYKEAWGWSGFDIKVAIVPPNRWRMATYLAMRPVWTGHKYEWAPEPARRMRGMFWQFDNATHPIAWARGIATQVRQQARAVPVLRDICDWYLHHTTGATMGLSETCSATNPYSPFYGAVMEGDMTERTLEEFCLDYHVKISDYDRFKSCLASTGSVLVNFDAYILHRIFSEES